MDPSSRRELWDLLVSMKERGRSVLFTTHYLEEADILADRKAVLARGKVQAVGTSRDLKLQFGMGYHLRVLLPATAPRAQQLELAELVREMVIGAKELDISSAERTQAADAPLEAHFTL